MSANIERKSCGLCGAPDSALRTVLELPPTPIANELLRSPQPQQVWPLNLVMCVRCLHVQLGVVLPPEILFAGDYVYTTGTSPVTRAHFSRYVGEVCQRFGLGPDSLVVEIGSNDGTVLREFRARGVGRLIGIDPARDIAVDIPEGATIRHQLFGSKLGQELAAEHGPANLIIANNVFAHAPDLFDMLLGVRALMDERSVFVLEVSYLLDVVEKILFDTIYHEHYSYHSVAPLATVCRGMGLKVFDVQRTDAQGGSIRVFIARDDSPEETQDSVGLAILEEREARIDGIEVFKRLGKRVRRRGDQVKRRLDAHLALGKKLVGYGAPAKLTTLMYAFGLEPRHAEMIIEDSPWKQGRFTPGLHIPIVGPQIIEASRAHGHLVAEVCTVFAWNYAESILRKCGWEFRCYVVPLPSLMEIGP